MLFYAMLPLLYFFWTGRGQLVGSANRLARGWYYRYGLAVHEHRALDQSL